MCEFCTQHGEGKKWYLQAKNFEEEALQGRERRSMTDNLPEKEQNSINMLIEFDKQIATDFNATRAGVISRVDEEKKQRLAQVVPIEDAEQILNISSSIVRLSCICRKIRGVHNARFCFGLNVKYDTVEDVHEYPDYEKDFEVVTVEEAKKLFHDFDHEGLVHIVLAQTPFITAICNCDSTYCGLLRMRARFQYQIGYLKSEYFSTVDWEKCNGCRECMKVCSSGAIRYSPAVEKVYIDQFKCYGSGVCRSVCPTNAITLHNRNTNPALAKEW